MGKRPRRSIGTIGEVVVDDSLYIENKSSKNARRILDRSEFIQVEIWCDKHYYTRAQLGDEGGRREGIEEYRIKSLISKSIQHLIYYSFKVRNFSFVNFGVKMRCTRTVIQEFIDNEMLNIVAEFHHLEYNKYQVTVITAMRNDSFKISLGQYAVEIIGDTSVLKKCEQNRIIEISTFV